MSIMPLNAGGQSHSPQGREVDVIPADFASYQGEPSALAVITRAEIDIQIATAKRYPRSLHRVLEEAKTMVSIDPELADECTYYLPDRGGDDRGNNRPNRRIVTDEKGVKWITGPSVRLAEILAACWGNLRIFGRIVDDNGKFVVAQAVAHDLEKNIAYGWENRRGVVTRMGKRYSDSMVVTTCNAAIAFATRNATFKVIPRAFVELVENEARKVARGDIASIPERTFKALEYLGAKGITEEQVFGMLDISGKEDMTLDRLVKLRGVCTALKEGTATIEELFSIPDVPTPEATANGGESRTKQAAAKIKGEARPATQSQPEASEAKSQTAAQPTSEPAKATTDAGKGTAPTAKEPPKTNVQAPPSGKRQAETLLPTDEDARMANSSAEA